MLMRYSMPKKYKLNRGFNNVASRLRHTLRCTFKEFNLLFKLFFNNKYITNCHDDFVFMIVKFID